MRAFPGLDQSYQHIEPVAFGSVALRRHQALDFLEDAAVVALGLDRCDVYGPAFKYLQLPGQRSEKSPYSR